MKNQEDIEKYIKTSMQEVTSFVDGIDLTSVEAAKEMILAAEKNKNRVHVTGIGKPGHVAGYAASLLSSTGTPTYELHGTEAVHGSAGQVLPGDVVLAISNSGETQELQATVQTLKQNGAKIIAVTGNKDSKLAKLGDTALIAGVKQEGDVLGKPPRASILAEIIILQVLSVALQYERDLKPEEYVKWHPGGAIGQSINERR